MTTTNVKNYPNSPYFDDYDETKGFYRILFRPGFSVQARELTQMQTAIQAQIDRLGQYAFKDGDRVIGGQLNHEFKIDYVKIEDVFTTGGTGYTTSNYLAEFEGTRIRGADTDGSGNRILATVIKVIAAADGDPITLFVKYESKGGANRDISTFGDGEILESFENADGTALAGVNRLAMVGGGSDVDGLGTASTISEVRGFGSQVRLDEGVFFIAGNFVHCPEQSLVLEKYKTNPSYSVYLTILDEIVTAASDASLYDNALGSPNQSAPGANRYAITLTLAKDNYVVDVVNDTTDNRILLKKYANGVIKVDETSTPERNQSELTTRLATRTYEESGDYTVIPFQLDVREHLNTGDGEGKYTSGQGGDRDKIFVGVEPGTAYVKGFRINTETVTPLVLDKPRANSDTFTVEDEALPFLVGNYITVRTATGAFTGTPDITGYSQYNLYDDFLGGGGNAPIGTCRIRDIEITGSTARVYIWDLDMLGAPENFGSIRSIGTAAGTGFFAELADPDGSQLTVSAVREDSKNNTAVFKLPYSNIKTVKQVNSGVVQSNIEVTYTVRLRATGLTIGGGSVSVNVVSGVLDNVSDVLVSVDGGDLVSATVGTGVGTGTFTVTGLSGTTAEVIYTCLRSGANSLVRSKTETNTTLNVTFSTGSKQYSLAVADVYRINSITDAAGNDYTSQFRLDTGARNNAYNLSKIVHTGQTIENNTVLTVDFDYYFHGPGDYFAVDSYYEASSASVAAQASKYEAIPAYSGVKGRINLRDALDFRPTETAVGVFSSTSPVRVNSVATSDSTFYMPRVDKVYLTKTGEFAIAKGASSIRPKRPKDPDGSMVLYTLKIPGYVYDVQQIKVIPYENKRYTMRDIGKLEDRIKRLEYYTSLSLLENSTKSLTFYDENGQARLNNGIFVDPFHGHNMGNVTHPDHNCAVHRATSTLRPKFTETNVTLIRDPSDTGLVVTNKGLATLPYTGSKYIIQPYASEAEYINPYNVFSWDGTLKLSPDTDEWKEVDVLPDVVINDEAMYDQFVASAEAAGIFGTTWNEWETNWTGVETDVSTETSTETETTDDGNSTNQTTTETVETTVVTTTTEQQSRTGTTTSVTSTTHTINIGSRVVEVNFVPFIRSRKIFFKGELLKPNTKMYAFFDGVDVTNYCSTDEAYTTAVYSPGGGSRNWAGHTEHYLTPGNLVTDASGKIEGSFIIPRNDALKFRTGSRMFVLTDDSNNSDIDKTTFCTAIYTAQGLIESIENVYINIKVPVIQSETVSDSRTVESSSTSTSSSSSTSSVTTPNPQPEQDVVTDPIEPPEDEFLQPITQDPQEVEAPNPAVPEEFDVDELLLSLANINLLLPIEIGPLVDPLAQSFIIDNASGAWIRSLDLYFKDKDPNLPVNVSLRFMSNGYPTRMIFPGSVVNLYPSQINTSEDGTSSTRAVFDHPVYIPQGLEVAICLICMSDLPQVFVATVGNFDLQNPDQRITAQPHGGVFFKSANASTWTPEQERDLKFTVNRCVFSTTPHTIKFIDAQPADAILRPNPFFFIGNPNGSECDIRVYHRDHGLHQSGDRVTISGVVGTINGIAASALNGTHTVSEQELDSYLIRVTGQCTTPNVFGGGNPTPPITATHQVQYSVANIIANEFKLPNMTIDYSMSTISGKSIDNTDETAYNTAAEYNNVSILPNSNMTFGSMRCIPNSLNTTNQGMSIVATFSNNGDNFVTPAIDMDRLSIIAVNNRINDPTSGTYNNASAGRTYVDDSEPLNSSSLSSYVSKRIVLNNESSIIHAYLNVNRPTGSTIELWYKAMEVGSNVDFDSDLNWVLANPSNPSSIPVNNASKYTEVEYEIEPGFDFGSFAFKIVFKSTSARRVPTCRDFRAIASL